MDIPLPHCYAYPRPAVSVDMAVFWQTEARTKILLIQRQKDPHKDGWAIPGGFIEMDETTEKAAHRELQEETSLQGLQLIRVDVFDAVDRDPRGRTISVAYAAFVTADQIVMVKTGDDAKHIGWYDINDLPELGFDHPAIIAAARQKLNI